MKYMVVYTKQYDIEDTIICSSGNIGVYTIPNIFGTINIRIGWDTLVSPTYVGSSGREGVVYKR